MRFIVILLISFFSTVIVHAQSSSCVEHHCLAVVDAGSTGSRLHVYAFDVDSHQTPIRIHELYSKKIEPGLSTVELNQPALNDYFSTLFSNTTETTLPVYFYATGGMRLLPEALQQAYYEKLTTWLASESQWYLMTAKTISGTEEGVYGWLAVNYNKGTLASTQKPLVGVMDTGGASVQITFPIANFQSVPSEDEVDLLLYGRHFTLFSHSFLGLGQIDLKRQFSNDPSCFANNYPLPNGSLAEGHFSLCEKNILPVINTLHHVDQTIQSVLNNNPVSSWYALGGLGAMAQDTLFSFENNQFTAMKLAIAANKEICHQDWSVLHTHYPKNDYLSAYCLNAAYYYALLTEGYGIHQDKPIHYFSNDQNDWTLGVVLHPE